VASPDNEDHPP
jgi:hypothetical protein